jgi:hypothetical protein
LAKLFEELKRRNDTKRGVSFAAIDTGEFRVVFDLIDPGSL